MARDWLPTILARFAADPGLQVLGGDIRMLTEVPGDPTQAEAYECVYAYRQRDYIERQGFSVTANLAFRREVFDRVGPFAGIAVAEDMDWGHRATAMGIRTATRRRWWFTTRRAARWPSSAPSGTATSATISRCAPRARRARRSG